MVKKNYGKKINIGKIKVIRISTNVKKSFDYFSKWAKLERNGQFNLLDSTITNYGRCTKETTIRIAVAKTGLFKTDCLFDRFNFSLRKRLLNNYVWCTALYEVRIWPFSVKLSGKLSNVDA